MIENDLYIACLNLAGKRALVVGAGRVALEKVNGLLACDAEVVVVAPEADPGITALVDDLQVTWIQKRFDADDLDGAMLVIAATADTEVNTAVFEAAETRSMLVNVVDVPSLCNFVLPAISRRGPIAVAISTSGASPALAKRIRREVEQQVGPEYAALATLLDEERGWAKETLPSYDARRIFFESIVEGQPDPIELLRDGDVDRVKEMIAAARETAIAQMKSG
ncbi:MAG: bifunctional precorrin-2 dehydrogenase/sirohydrochlorin ferrochelatase [Actinobacteria bacterium]|nr:bifunctional precorrin-2 dehydrogenase/sirohydrochlorin ferrochelatase [Actinomycetota bacterium]